MKALDRKLLRDLWQLRMQALTIALVVAVGIGGFVGSLSTHDSLVTARDRYYAQARFADVFASVRRAPDALAARLSALPGVAQAQFRLVFDTQVAIDGVRQPLAGRIIGTQPAELADGLNRVTLRAGRLPAAGSDEAVVNLAFARARSLSPGDTVSVLLDGRRQTLRIVGIGLSPEYIYASAEGMLSDDRAFGIFWMDRKRLAAALDMDGAFNTASLRLVPGTAPEPVIAAVDQVLEPWGSRGAHDRRDQPSERVLAGEIQQQRAFGIILPSIFLTVAVFILNVVLGRQVATQRDQIAALKALGYDDRRIVVHYLKLAAVIVLLGIVAGFGIGEWLGRWMTGIYTDFFNFPGFYFRNAPWIIGVSASVCVSTALLGCWHSVDRLVAQRAADAMRPPSPAVYRPLLIERAGFGHLIGPSGRIILRGVERRPLRALLTVTGIASAVAILIAGTWWNDAIDHLLEVQFNAAQPADIYIGLRRPDDPAVAHALARLPGTLRAEVSRTLAVRLHAGHLNRRVMLQGLSGDAQLRRPVDDTGRAVPMPAAGVLLTDRLARALGIGPGDPVRIEFLEGARRERTVIVAGLLAEPMGFAAYADPATLALLAGESTLVNSGALRLDGGDPGPLYDALRELPAVAGVFIKAALLAYTRETSAKNILVFTGVLTAFAAAIAVGVVYNSARIALAERAWELATLRVLGMTQSEVAVLLFGELAIELALGIPLGLVGGYHLAGLLVQAISNEQIGIPVIILPRTYAWAGLTMLAAGCISAWIVQRRLARLDLVGVLKTRE